MLGSEFSLSLSLSLSLSAELELFMMDPEFSKLGPELFMLDPRILYDVKVQQLSPLDSLEPTGIQVTRIYSNSESADLEFANWARFSGL